MMDKTVHMIPPCTCSGDLQNLVNKWIKENSANVEVFDIKYALACDEKDMFHAAMIIYEEDE